MSSSSTSSAEPNSVTDQAPRIGENLQSQQASQVSKRGSNTQPLAQFESRAVAVLLIALLSLLAFQIIRSRFAGTVRLTNIPAQTLVDLNTASEAELVHLPGIGPALAARILDNRNRMGPFLRPNDLQRVPGIGPKTVARILPYLTNGSQASEVSVMAGVKPESHSISRSE